MKFSEEEINQAIEAVERKQRWSRELALEAETESLRGTHEFNYKLYTARLAELRLLLDLAKGASDFPKNKAQD